MCFSAETSLFASTGLFASFIYILKTSKNYSMPVLVSASLPLGFAIQQLVEGFIWLAIPNGNYQIAYICTLIYSFFAQWFWPVLIPFFGLINEPNQIRRLAFYTVLLIGIIFGGCHFISVILHDNSVRAEIVNQCIAYNHTPYIMMPNNLYMLTYLLTCPLCLLISSHKKVRIASLLGLLAFIAAKVYYDYAFASVWCFFAAIISFLTIRVENDFKQQRSMAFSN